MNRCTSRGQVATAHGSDMSSLLSNPELVILLGGLEAVTLGDAAAAKDNNHRKTRLERKGLPVFDTVVEVIGQVCSKYVMKGSVGNTKHTASQS